MSKAQVSPEVFEILRKLRDRVRADPELHNITDGSTVVTPLELEAIKEGVAAMVLSDRIMFRAALAQFNLFI